MYIILYLLLCISAQTDRNHFIFPEKEFTRLPLFPNLFHVHIAHIFHRKHINTLIFIHTTPNILHNLLFQRQSLFIGLCKGNCNKILRLCFRENNPALKTCNLLFLSRFDLGILVQESANHAKSSFNFNSNHVQITLTTKPHELFLTTDSSNNDR